MHIILVSTRLTRARSVTLTPVHLLLGGIGAAFLIMLLSVTLFFVTVRYASELRVPVLDSLLLSIKEQESRKADSFLRENLNAMAVKLGQMQAQLMRLDALGERLSSLAGLKPNEFRFNELPGRGGAVSTSVPPQDLSMADFNRHLEQLSRQMENRTDYLGVLESMLFESHRKET